MCDLSFKMMKKSMTKTMMIDWRTTPPHLSKESLLNGDASFDSKEPSFHDSGSLTQQGHDHFDWKKANENGDAF